MFSRYQFHFILNITISLPTRHIITHEANYIVLLYVIKERTINKYKDYSNYHTILKNLSLKILQLCIFLKKICNTYVCSIQDVNSY